MLHSLGFLATLWLFLLSSLLLHLGIGLSQGLVFKRIHLPFWLYSLLFFTNSFHFTIFFFFLFFSIVAARKMGYSVSWWGLQWTRGPRFCPSGCTIIWDPVLSCSLLSARGRALQGHKLRTIHDGQGSHLLGSFGLRTCHHLGQNFVRIASAWSSFCPVFPPSFSSSQYLTYSIVQRLSCLPFPPSTLHRHLLNTSLGQIQSWGLVLSKYDITHPSLFLSFCSLFSICVIFLLFWLLFL